MVGAAVPWPSSGRIANAPPSPSTYGIQSRALRLRLSIAARKSIFVPRARTDVDVTQTPDAQRLGPLLSGGSPAREVHLGTPDGPHNRRRSGAA